MPDERCEIELLKQELKSFKEICEERWDREDEYLMEFKKNLHEVSINLQKVIDKQNSQVGYIAGVASTITLIGGVIAWFFSK